MFEEQFDYKDEEKHSLQLHLEKPLYFAQRGQSKAAFPTSSKRTIYGEITETWRKFRYSLSS